MSGRGFDKMFRAPVCNYFQPLVLVGHAGLHEWQISAFESFNWPVRGSSESFGFEGSSIFVKHVYI